VRFDRARAYALRFGASLAHSLAVVHARCRRSRVLLFWTLSVSALGGTITGIIGAERAHAEPNPGALPPAVPTVLMTRDPSRASASMSVGKRRPKPAAVTPVPAVTPAPNSALAPAKTAVAVATLPAAAPNASQPTATSNASQPTAASNKSSGPAKAGPAVAVTASASVLVPSKAPVAANAAAPSEPHSNIKIKGLTGTLNKGDIHQTMESRQELFDACIEDSRRRVRWVSGAIRFAFKVDADGRIADVHPTTSDIGHRELEQCLTAAVAATQFPKPAGRASAEFAWGLSVESANGRPLETASPKIMASLVRKQVRDVFGTCEIRRRRARFRITAYIAPGGRMLSAGVVPLPAKAEDKADCVLEQFAKWHMPKVKRSSKVSFELR
jgi:hypothetical protein